MMSLVHNSIILWLYICCLTSLSVYADNAHRHSRKIDPTSHQYSDPTCKANVRMKLIPEEQLECTGEAVDCLHCGDQCKGMTDVQNALNQNVRLKCGNRRIEINCCLVARMKNFGRPLDTGQFRCYSKTVHDKFNKTVNVPLLDCPFGKKGNNCEETYTLQFLCNCAPVHYHNLFPAQDTMSECNEERRNPSWQKCYISVLRDGEDFICHCNNSTGKLDDSIEDCSQPNTGQVMQTNQPNQPNGFQESHLFIWNYLLILVSCVIVRKMIPAIL